MSGQPSKTPLEEDIEHAVAEQSPRDGFLARLHTLMRDASTNGEISGYVVWTHSDEKLPLADYSVFFNDAPSIRLLVT